MRKLGVFVGLLVISVIASAATGKISSQWKCDAKAADEHNIPTGDREGHTYHLGQGKCASVKGAMGDVKEQEGTWTEFDDISGNTMEKQGVFVVTLASGDKVAYNYRGSQTMKDSMMESGKNTWTITGGTGKFEGAKGRGGCTGKGNPDGSSLWTCNGSYSAGK